MVLLRHGVNFMAITAVVAVIQNLHVFRNTKKNAENNHIDLLYQSTCNLGATI